MPGSHQVDSLNGQFWGRKSRFKQLQEVTSQDFPLQASDLRWSDPATYTLYAGEGEQFRSLIAGWPRDLKSHIHSLAEGVFKG